MRRIKLHLYISHERPNVGGEPRPEAAPRPLEGVGSSALLGGPSSGAAASGLIASELRR